MIMYSNIRIRSSLLLKPLIRPTSKNSSSSIPNINLTPTVSCSSITNTINHNNNNNNNIKSFSTNTTKSKQTQKPTLQSYNETKQNQKAYRTNLYNKQQERQANLPKRRLQSVKGVKRNAFHNWFDSKKQKELYYDREARRLNQEWKIKLGLMIERLPVVTDDREDWEIDYMYMKAEYDRERSIVYPKEIIGFEDPMESKIMTIEEIYEMLPEGYKPAPRITEADKNNIIQTLDRKLPHRVYLALRPNDEIGWTLPITDLNPMPTSKSHTLGGETFVDAVKRFIASNKMLKDMDIRCLSNCPMAVEAIPYNQETEKDKSENGKYFGEKVFYMRVQYEEGQVGKVDKTIHDWGWLERSEMVDRVKTEKGEDASLFYHYML